MNREIIYRGKRCSDGKWVYGFYVESKQSWKGHKPHKSWIVTGAISNGGFFNILGRYAVKDDTVGQFTGFLDKNGKKIFEGDIVRSPLGNIVAVEFGYKEHIVKHGRPQITDGFACYGWIARNVKNGITDFFDNEFVAGEVIGNIYDNQDLLNKK